MKKPEPLLGAPSTAPPAAVPADWALEIAQIAHGLCAAVRPGRPAPRLIAPGYAGGAPAEWVLGAPRHDAESPDSFAVAYSVGVSRTQAPRWYPTLGLFANIATGRTGLAAMVMRFGGDRFAALTAAMTLGPVLLSAAARPDGPAASGAPCLVSGVWAGAVHVRDVLAAAGNHGSGDIRVLPGGLADFANEYVVLCEPGAVTGRPTADEHFASYWAG